MAVIKDTPILPDKRYIRYKTSKELSRCRIRLVKW